METLSIQRQSIRSISITGWLNRKNDFYSSLIDETVSNRFVINMNHCLIAFVATATAAGCSLLATLLCAAWFVVSLFICKKGGMR
jgi:hypothetical protein